MHFLGRPLKTLTPPRSALYESFIKFLNNLRSPHQWGRGPMGDSESYLSFGKCPKIHL